MWISRIDIMCRRENEFRDRVSVDDLVAATINTCRSCAQAEGHTPSHLPCSCKMVYTLRSIYVIA